MEKDLLMTGQVVLVSDPVRGNWGIHKLHALVHENFNLDDCGEVWVIFRNKALSRLLIYHEDRAGRDVLVRLINRGFFQLFNKQRLSDLTREDIRRILLDGTLPDHPWQNPLAQTYLSDHPELGYFAGSKPDPQVS